MGERSRIRVIGTPAELPPPPAAPWIRVRPFDRVTTVICPAPLTAAGQKYDAGAIYHRWEVTTSVPALVSFGSPPSGNEFPQPGGTQLTYQVRAQTVFYRTPPGSTASGSVMCRLFRYD